MIIEFYLVKVFVSLILNFLVVFKKDKRGGERGGKEKEKRKKKNGVALIFR